MKKFLTLKDLERGRSAAERRSYDRVGKVPAASVLKHTGKNWEQWIRVLEKAGAPSWSYREIVEFLKKKHRLTPWWQQGVALGFEIATGRRLEGQDAKGKYMVTATKSIAHDVRKVWSFATSEEGLKVWLQPLSEVTLRPKEQFETADGFFGEVRTVTKNRRARLFWQDPLWPKHTVLELLMVSRPGKKMILVFNHTGIQDVRSKERFRVRWRKAADELAERLES